MSSADWRPQSLIVLVNSMITRFSECTTATSGVVFVHVLCFLKSWSQRCDLEGQLLSKQIFDITEEVMELDN